MGERRLAPDEHALWAQVAATVRRPGTRSTAPRPLPVPLTGRSLEPLPPRKGRPVGTTLDAGWDRRLAQGKVAPDRVIDLHGLTLSAAHAQLDRTLLAAVRGGERLVLMVTGRARGETADRLRPGSRGLIRASIVDWIEAGPFAADIGAIRPAHIRHGGHGALYVVLRRRRELR